MPATLRPARRTGVLAAAVTLLLLALPAVLGPAARAEAPAAPTAATAVGTPPRVFAYYYLWWSANHWRSSLGSAYPTTASPLPLPARLDATGCHPTSLYAGNVLTDVPSRLYSQDDPGFLEADVRQAAAAGLAGFAVNWAGDGTTTQTDTSTPYSRRLKVLVDAVHEVNAEGVPFSLWLSYKASATVLPTTAVQGDLTWFARRYGADPAFDRTASSRPTVIWQGSRKYSLAQLQAVSQAQRAGLRLLGDETTWSQTRAPYLEGNAYYWSSQDPYRNPASFGQVAALATAVRSSPPNRDGSRKAWVAPLTPGYDKQLAGGTNCVPRKGGATLRAVYTGNAASRPDAWGLISWNEITEGTYVDPMTRYGTQELDVLRSLVAGS